MSGYSHEITDCKQSYSKVQNQNSKGKNICTIPGTIPDTYPMKMNDPNSIDMRKLSENSGERYNASTLSCVT